MAKGRGRQTGGRVAKADESAVALVKAEAAMQRGRLDEAARHFRHYLEREPGDAARWHLLAGLEYRRGDPTRAVRALEQATTLQPGNGVWMADLGGLYLSLGRPADAERVLRAARARPDPAPEVAYNLAQALFDQDRVSEAAAELRALLALQPGIAPAHFNLGVALRTLGQWPAALGAFEACARLDPAVPSVQLELARCLRQLNRPAAALEAYDRHLARAPADAEARTEQARLLYGTGEARRAIELLERASAERPGQPAIECLLASLLHNTGDLDGAEAAFSRALATAPRDVRAWAGLVQLRRVTSPEDAILQRLAQLRRAASPGSAEAVELDFALGKALDDLGDHEAAFRHFAAGNAVRAGHAAYDRRALEMKVGRTIELFDGAQIARLRALGDRSALPVLVVGMPRSGTTLVEQIIASHPEACGAGELRFFPALAARLPELAGTATPYPEGCAELDAAMVARICSEYLALLHRHSQRARRVTDKLPGNFLYLGLALGLFPEARAIDCRRTPADVCLSIYFQNFAEQHDYAWNLEDVAHFHGQYERLMAHWRALFPAQILAVRYEDTVADLPAAARRLLAHCGLDWDPRCLEFHRTRRDVRTASNTQVREPVYTRSLRRWTRYARFLPPSVLALNERYGEPAA